MDKELKYLNNIQHSQDQYFDGFSSYNQLDHGFEFIQQYLHWLLHQTDRAREAFGGDSDQYQAMVGRVANTMAPFSNGGNFTMNELSHFDHFHHQTVQDATILQRQLGQLPFTSYPLGYNFVNVIPNKGNASGSGTGGDNINTVSPNVISTPHVQTPSVRTPSVSVGGVSFKRGGMSKNITQLKDIPGAAEK